MQMVTTEKTVLSHDGTYIFGVIEHVSHQSDEVRIRTWKGGTVVVSSYSLTPTAADEEFRLTYDIDLGEPAVTTEVVRPAITSVLAERGSRYGTFADNANMTQAMKNIVRTGRAWANATTVQQEAMDMIAHKLSRIANGDPSYADSWVDIIGYAQLALNGLSINTNE